MTKKVYTIKVRHGSFGCKSRERTYTGTVEDLTQIFSYTLECGNSWNPKINTKPKTAKSLVKCLNSSANEMRRYFDIYELVEDK